MYRKVNEELIRIGENVLFFRSVQGYTQAELAEKTNLSSMTISLIETGSTTN